MTNETEGKAVQPIIYEPTRIDPFKIVSLVATIVTITLSGAGIYFGLKAGQESNSTELATLKATVETMRQFSLTRAALADANAADTKAKLDAVSNVPYRVGVLESNYSEMNRQLLTTIEAIRKDVATSNETLRKDVNAISTQVQVLDSKVNDLKANPPLRPRPTTLELRSFQPVFQTHR